MVWDPLYRRRAWTPEARTHEELALTGGKWMIAATFKDADKVSAPPFESHTFALDVLWPDDLV